MQKITRKNQYEKLKGLPPPVWEEIKRNAELLNQYYGENRNTDESLGGYVLLIEDERDLKELEEMCSEEGVSYQDLYYEEDIEQKSVFKFFTSIT